jgi:hypothetical protein
MTFFCGPATRRLWEGDPRRAKTRKRRSATACALRIGGEDGSTWRPLYSLGTTDKALASRKLMKSSPQFE